ncbi:MAG: hypothetical protein ACJAZF_005029, partial [Granulosicoccus sp.]
KGKAWPPYERSITENPKICSCLFNDIHSTTHLSMIYF